MKTARLNLPSGSKTNMRFLTYGALKQIRHHPFPSNSQPVLTLTFVMT